MGNFINFDSIRRKELITSVLNQHHSGESIEIIDLTEAVSERLRMYHNQKCDPDSSCITNSEIKELKELLHVLIKGIEESEDI